MKTSYAVALLLTMILTGTYWYTSVEAVCRLPIYYKIGTIDERFDLTFEEARNQLSDAESVWEESTGRNLFTYDENSNLSVNFIYDERQQTATEVEAWKHTLDAKENVNSALSETYAELVSAHGKKQAEFEDMRASYERRLSNYNEEVQSYNDDGGAPLEVFADLEARKKVLDKDLAELTKVADSLNELSDQINDIGERGNTLIQTYNDSVSRFNEEYVSNEEFTQGDYQGKSINIYTYKDFDELKLVLVHELGHAMSLDHVENQESVMYYLMGEQPTDLKLSPQDLNEFQGVCGDVTTYQRVKEQIINWLKVRGVL